MNVIGFKKARCKNCYKCVRVCKVKAINFRNDQAEIVSDRCVLCGECLEACPQNAKTYIRDLERVKSYLERGKKTVISIAPSYIGAFKTKDPGTVIGALKKLGFTAVRETAEGAAYVTQEYVKLIEKGEMKNIITTCCPSVNELAEIYYPEIIDQLAPVVSPMIAHGKILREIYGPEAKIVFLGPCISKKREAIFAPETKGYIDGVLTFQEMEEWFRDGDIRLDEVEPALPENPNPLVNRLYPVSNGIITSVMASKKIQEDRYDKFYADGMKNCMDLLESLRQGEIENCFIEMNLCNGGCIQGHGMGCPSTSRFRARMVIQKNVVTEGVGENFFEREEVEENCHGDSAEIKPYKAFEKDIREEMKRSFHDRHIDAKYPSEERIRKILEKTGKFKEEDELNCGACGYPSCRAKAVAVYQGMAELSMCMPYMEGKAQSLANIVMDTTPNIILVADSELKIIELSKAAERYFKLSKMSAQEKHIFEILDPTDFFTVLDTKRNIFNKKVKPLGKDEYTILQTIIYVEEIQGVLAIFQDISQEEERLKQAYKLKMDTIEMAQKVIDNQMMVAQEIAGLLGETTAETKVTLTKLRDMIFYDGEKS